MGSTIKNLYIAVLMGLSPELVVATDPPVADFFVVPTTGWNLYYRPEFVSISTGHITSYYWDFGDGTTSTTPAPNHKYSESGVYTIILVVSGPFGTDTLRKENYITVKDFSDYPYPTYVVEEPTMAALDSVMDVIQDSQLDGPDPNDPVWWNESMIDTIEHGGGGRVVFGFSNDTIFVDHHRDFYGDNLIIDGEGKNVHFYYNGPDSCDQTEGQDALLRIHGNDNVFRNVNFDRFPDGVHLRGGQRNLIENVRVNIICEDAMTMNGGGFKVYDAIVRDCFFQESEDKTIMVNNGAGAMIIRGCTSYNGEQPIRMTGGGLLVVRHCEFSGDKNNGPRFGGNDNLVIFENNYSNGTRSGLRLSDHVRAIVRRNTIENCSQYGIRIYRDEEDCFIRIEDNVVKDNTIGIVIERNAKVDLGGGLLDVHQHGFLSGPGISPVSSIGFNTLVTNRIFDLNNNTSDTVKAENNIWDHKTVDEVLSLDVRGNVDVDPLNPWSVVRDDDNGKLPENLPFFEAYPNPFNDSVTIQYYLPHAAWLSFDVLNAMGKNVRRLSDSRELKGYGRLIWNGRDEKGTSISTGPYYIRMKTKSDGDVFLHDIKTQKVLYVK